ncbi:MAG TPA: nuclear transport factor 2 family protein [Acidimicrobiales bacterium]|nr:nuclear transport factor 2 family protein [Acidimicrobiales bacterium]
MSDDAEARIRALEERIGALEDQLALYRLVSTYGPAVDTGSGTEAAALWAEDGAYEFDTSRLDGPEGIAAMVAGETHQALIRQGCAHILALPVVTVDGDQASATGYSRVYRHMEDGYEVWRVSANHWRFRRTPEGWKVTHRVNRTLDGSPEARRILRRAFDDETEGTR